MDGEEKRKNKEDHWMERNKQSVCVQVCMCSFLRLNVVVSLFFKSTK